MTTEEICSALALYLSREMKAGNFEGHDPLFSVNFFLNDEKDRQSAEEYLRHDDQFVALSKGIYTLYARKRDEAYWRAYLRYRVALRTSFWRCWRRGGRSSLVRRLSGSGDVRGASRVLGRRTGPVPGLWRLPVELRLRPRIHRVPCLRRQ